MSVERVEARNSSSAVVPLAQANHAFLEREAFNREILEALPVAVYVTDTEGRILFYNQAAAELAGRRPVVGVDHWCVTWKLYWPDGAPLPHDECPMALALKYGQEPRGIEAVAERPDGTRIAFMPFPTLVRDARGQVVGAVNVLVDITERKKAEERQRLLTHEVNHRANNLLTIIQAMVRLTKAEDVEAFRSSLSGRVDALAHAHGLLAKSRWIEADLQQLVSEEMAPYMQKASRVWFSGAPLPMNPASAQSMALIIHELATNAAKYGALSSETGSVMIEWGLRRNEVFFRWQEAGGPACRAPVRRGVGSAVVERAACYLDGQAAYQWKEGGLAFELSAPKATMLADGDPEAEAAFKGSPLTA